MKDEAKGLVAISGESATRRVGFIRVTESDGDLMPSKTGNSRAAATAKADGYVDKYAANFGARPGELQRDGVAANGAGWTVTYTQSYKGVDVFGALLRAHVDKQGDLTSVNGFAAPALSLSTTPRVSAVAAGEAAVGTVRANPPGDEGDADTTGIHAASTDLVVYRLGSPKGETGQAILAWVVEVTNGANIRDMVFLDATTGKLVNRYSLVHDALERELYEEKYHPSGLKWKEGDRFPGKLDVDQQNEVLGTGDAYWFFKDSFGRDSYDGAGHKMITVNNDPRISCPNANWNGVTTNYCSGVSSDDVVAHEWGHAYTEYTHGLIYQWQSGALNESYSDIWGETVDLINGRMDGDEGNIGAKRTVGLCAEEGPRSVQLVINSPDSIKKVCVAGAANWGATPTTTGVTGDIVLGLDPADAAGPATNDGCSPLTNAAAVKGKIGLVQRGTCAFTQKATNLLNAGATAAVIYNNNNGGPFTPGGGIDPPMNIPVIGISQADGERITGALPSGSVNGTVRLSGSASSEASYRWLMGEDSSAFGGAIRDMWVPTCAGDPGKVSDAEYVCSTEDGGGVHSNSGVPNHGYALLVDGGAYNGVEVKGIGLDKAAAIYWRAMTEYQTPTTDFTDHADALASSCLDLVGQPIRKLTTAANATPSAAASIRRADCAQVGNMTAAVELRRDPAQCAFKPLFDPNTPELCGAGGTRTDIWKEDFEDGLAGWTTDQQVVFRGGFGKPWEASTKAPGGHTGGVAYGPAPDLGNCSAGSGDFSSSDSITSPEVPIPAGAATPRFEFDHYVSTESGYDGGNVKVSVNGGAFTVIPAAAYTFNGPGKLTDASTNTNPMAGEEGFTGTDGGEVVGTWGTSQVDLTKAGVKAGDRVKLRFDIGRDGCGGLDGWYVDNIEVAACLGAPVATGTAEGRRS